MKIATKSLPASRRQVTVTLTADEVDQHFDRALELLAKTVKLTGFRPGKAPIELVKQNVDPAKLREEAYSQAVGAAWREAVKDIKEVIIQDPEVDLQAFSAGATATIVFAFDVRPEVKVGDWRRIKLEAVKASEVTDEDVQKLISSLSQAHAATKLKLQPAARGDKLEVDFSGSLKGVRLDKLTAKKFPVVIGQGSTIPGFDDQLIGLKKGETKQFPIKFPQTHFDKELAAQTADFEVVVNEVFEVILPELNEEFAKKFGHKTTKQLTEAIRQDIARQRNEEGEVTQRAKWLAEFAKLVTVDIPESLLAVEIERSRQNWQQFLQERHLNEADWLKSRQLTLEKLEHDWREAARANVTIGLGLTSVANELKREIKTNEEFQTLLEELVAQAVK